MHAAPATDRFGRALPALMLAPALLLGAFTNASVATAQSGGDALRNAAPADAYMYLYSGYQGRSPLVDAYIDEMLQAVLDARFDQFVTPQVELNGREQAHAPDYSVAAGGRYTHSSGFFARVDAIARDEFYFDVSHDQESRAYTLVHARAGYETGRWSVELWARNLFDTDYAVRGFFFGNEPPDFVPALYTRSGDPRQFGVSLDMYF